jgi:rhamnose utilization protein RhaD (predicted bifunctional aldolase and dehydrogenase)
MLYARRDIENFVRISKYAGMREDLVQAGGGNVSVKLNARNMLIKSSGQSLADVDFKYGFSVVNYSLLRSTIKTLVGSNSEVDKNIEKDVLRKAIVRGNRPSIETFLHAITKKYTLHTHPILVNALTCRRDGMSIIKKLFPSFIFVDYATPGMELALKCFKSLICCDLQIIFLKNHGLLISAENAEYVIRKTETIIDKIAKYLKVDFSQYTNATKIYNKFNTKLKDQGIFYLIKNQAKNIFKALKYSNFNFCICPDAVVYCGKKILFLKDPINLVQIGKYIKKFGRPIVFYYQGEFYIYAKNLKKAKEIESVLLSIVDIFLLNKNKKIDFLSNKEQNFLLNWDFEKYRQIL